MKIKIKLVDNYVGGYRRAGETGVVIQTRVRNAPKLEDCLVRFEKD